MHRFPERYSIRNGVLWWSCQRYADSTTGMNAEQPVVFSYANANSIVKLEPCGQQATVCLLSFNGNAGSQMPCLPSRIARAVALLVG
jgi:hypothetical protein